MDPQIEELKKQIQDLKDQIKDNVPNLSRSKNEDLNKEEIEEYSWDAPVRVFVKWERKSIMTSILWTAIVSLVLILLQEYILFITIVFLVAVSLLLVIIPPKKTKHIITNKGIKSYERLYLWEDLTDFWFAKRKGSVVLYIDTKLNYPIRLFFVVPKKDLVNVYENLSKYLKYFERRTKQSYIGKFSDGEYIRFNDIKTLV